MRGTLRHWLEAHGAGKKTAADGSPTNATVSRFQFVADHSTAFPVQRLCQLLEVARRSYYARLKAAPGTATPNRCEV